MKFTDGYWLMRPGVRANFAAQAYDVESDADSVTVYAPTRTINHRGDTLQGPVLTLRLSSPMPDVVRVNVAHYTGHEDRVPHFPLFGEGTGHATPNIDDDFVGLTSGELSVRIPRKGFSIDFLAGGRRLTGSAWRGLGYVEVPDGAKYVHEQLDLGVGECVYGLGERFSAFVKNGQVVDIWNEDGGTSSEQAYKNVPFYLTNRGYGVFVNDTRNVSFEVASEKVSRVQFSVPGESLEYFVIYGPTPKEILAKYTALTGRPALPPAWSFGLWLTTSFTTNYDEQTVTDILDNMSKRDLPLHVFHFDCFWMKEYHWSNFLWDDRTFPNPQSMLKRLKDRGLHICVWINSYIAQRSHLFEEGKKNGYLIKKADGSVWQTDLWQPGMGIVDFTNPDACKWYTDKLSALLDMGVDSFKTDFGERIPTDVVYHDGSDPQGMHNFYPYLYNKTVFDLLEQRRGVGEATLFARSATAGCQQFPVHWGGDCYSSFESMAESLRGGLSLCTSGFGFWSHDIGGFEGMPPADLYKRWIAFGLLSSHSRLHGSSSYRVPWLFDENPLPNPGLKGKEPETAVEVLRFFTKLKCSLMPYLFAKATEARDGIPLMRAMILEFPDDPGCAYLDRQYLLGDSLMVAPVFSADNVAEYYVPAGRWTNFLNGNVVVGPAWIREEHGFTSAALLARPGSVIPVGAVDTRPDYDYTDGVTFRVYEIADGSDISAVVTTVTGDVAVRVTVTRRGSRIEATVDDPSIAWRLQLIGVPETASVEGASATSTPQGILLAAQGGAGTIVANVPG